MSREKLKALEELQKVDIKIRDLSAEAETHPARLRFLDRVNYFGQAAELDAQGRVIIPVRLREAATMSGDVRTLSRP